MRAPANKGRSWVNFVDILISNFCFYEYWRILSQISVFGFVPALLKVLKEHCSPAGIIYSSFIRSLYAKPQMTFASLVSLFSITIACIGSSQEIIQSRHESPENGD